MSEIPNFNKVTKSRGTNKCFLDKVTNTQNTHIRNISEQRNVFTPQLASKKISITPPRDIKHYMSRQKKTRFNSRITSRSPQEKHNHPISDEVIVSGRNVNITVQDQNVLNVIKKKRV